MGGTNGYKTRQRELILDFLTANKNRHLSVDDVVNYLRDQHSPVGKSTVYRYLDRLVEQGSVRKYFMEEGKCACYQYEEDGEACHQHFHLKCMCCGDLIHVECSYLKNVAQHVFEDHHFTIDHTKTVLYGLCGKCSDRAKGDSTCEK